VILRSKFNTKISELVNNHDPKLDMPLNVVLSDQPVTLCLSVYTCLCVYNYHARFYFILHELICAVLELKYAIYYCHLLNLKTK
jgi:hypothetical protein